MRRPKEIIAALLAWLILAPSWESARGNESDALTIEERIRVSETGNLESMLAKAKSDRYPSKDCLKIVENLASEWCRLGDYAKAETILRSNILEYDHTPGNQTYEFAECLGLLSNALDHQKRFAEALEMRKRQFLIEEKILTDDDFHKGVMYYLLGYSQLKDKDSEGANASLKKALSIFEKLPPQQSPDEFIESYALLAETEADKNNFKAAVKDCITCVRLAELFRGVYCQSNCWLSVRIVELLKRCGAHGDADRLEHRYYVIGAAMRVVGIPVGKTPKRPHWEYKTKQGDDITIDVLLKPKPSI